MKVYISGPITGNADYRIKFRMAERELREQGHIPYDPAAINSMMPVETSYEEYMRMSLVLLDMCDAIQLLPGWDRSLGANREYGYALAKDKVIFEPSNPPAELYE